MKVWALIPARGGSKSIPLKNLVGVRGVPMIEYGVRAALASGRCERLVCSTEHDGIAEVVTALGVEIDRRPAHLCGDDTPVAEVAREWLARTPQPPDIVALIQPTSPFLLPEHITAALDALIARPDCRSVQTITPIPHNHHAWNQREFDGERVNFRFREERARAYNKQSKPALYSFGNFVAIRSSALLDGEAFFAEPSAAVAIERPYDFDLDTAEDLCVAEALLNSGLVSLPHLIPPTDSQDTPCES